MHNDGVQLKQKGTVTVVMPLYREGSHLSESFEVIRGEAERCGMSCNFVLVDDGSPDNTWDVVQDLCQRHGNISAIRFSRNFGKEAALAAGLDEAQGDAVIVIDCDLQHPPELIPQMVDCWLTGEADVVNAVKASRGHESGLHRSGALLFNKLLTLLSGFSFSGSSDFKLMDRRVVNAYLDLQERHTFYRGLIAWLGFRHAELPMEIRPRAGGTSRWAFLSLLRLAVTGLTSFSTLALHAVTALGLLFLLASFVGGVYALYQWVTGNALEGFTTVIIVQLMVGSVIMIALGIIGEYLSIIFDEVKRRPRYVVAEQYGSHPKE